MLKKVKNNNKLWNENGILNAWSEAKIFEKSVNNKEGGKNGEYIFFDGPPFANGLPHYGHLLTGFVKDTFARYHTSLGKKCERKFGWDCHGLPAEMESEKELKITGRLAIKNFSGNAKSQVLSISALNIFIKTLEYKELSSDKKNIINQYIDKLKDGTEIIQQNNNILNIIQETQFYKGIPNEICDENGKNLFGIAAFNQHCRNSVMKYTNEWEYYVTRQGRWVDFENSYKTMDLPYMESVISAFGKLYEKGLIYESTRVMPYSWKCETTLSNFETKMDNSYREKESKTCVVKFKLTDCAVGELKNSLTSIKGTLIYTTPARDALDIDAFKHHFQDLLESQQQYNGCSPDIWNKYINFTSVYFLAWTTTPWTLPSNLALAVGGDIKYRIYVNNGDAFIIAEDLIYKYEKELEVFEQKLRLRIEGKHLKDLKYEPLFPYFKDTPNAFRVLVGDFVSTEDGTGIVHMAPGFGEDDFNLCRANNIPVICPLDDSGKFSDTKIMDLPYKLGEKHEILKLFGRCVLEEKTNDKGKTDYDGVNEDIIKYLKSQNLWLKTEQYFHNYPHCWRTDTPLIYKAVSSWYVNVAGDGQGKVKIPTKNGDKTIKERMVELNHGWIDSSGLKHDGINWIPEHIRDGQFGKWLEGSRDWSISRNRFFGCPMPVWRVPNIIDSMPEGFSSPEALDEAFNSKENQNRIADIINRKRAIKPKVFSSIAEMEEFFRDDYIADYKNGKNSGKYIQTDGTFKITDLHRPYVDELVKYEDGFKMRRIEDVFDCWFESGSMPFASVGFTDFTQNEINGKQSTEQEATKKPSNFPADFIVEYVAQTRGWFYTLMILGTALFDEAPFKNCICHGVILDSKGEKLSKRLQNYPDPKEIFEKYGADSMRWFLLKSPVMRGGDLYMDATGDQIKDVSRTVITPFMSAFNFFKTYSNIDKIECIDIINKADKVKSEMNKYILSLTIKTINDIKIAMNSYDTPSACSSFENFLDSLNNLYIRRSKAAFWESEKSNEKQEAFNTLYSVILNISKAVSSLLPFTTEIIFQQINETSHNQAT